MEVECRFVLAARGGVGKWERDKVPACRHTQTERIEETGECFLVENDSQYRALNESVEYVLSTAVVFYILTPERRLAKTSRGQTLHD